MQQRGIMSEGVHYSAQKDARAASLEGFLGSRSSKVELQQRGVLRLSDVLSEMDDDDVAEENKHYTHHKPARAASLERGLVASSLSRGLQRRSSAVELQQRGVLRLSDVLSEMDDDDVAEENKHYTHHKPARAAAVELSLGSRSSVAELKERGVLKLTDVLAEMGDIIED
jgi:hypothetical protein